MQKKVKLQKTNAITVFGAGHQALAEIEGLRGMAVRGMFFNYLIFFDSFTGVERFVLFSTSRSVYQLAFWWRRRVLGCCRYNSFVEYSTDCRISYCHGILTIFC